MVRDLDMDVELVVCPIVREKDGLAMSSRNAYLSADQRKQALVLHRSLAQVEKLIQAGEHKAQKLIEAGQKEFGRVDSNAAPEASVRLDYFEIVSPETLDPVEDVSNGALVAVAAYVGTTRLINNLLLPKR